MTRTILDVVVALTLFLMLAFVMAIATNPGSKKAPVSVPYCQTEGGHYAPCASLVMPEVDL